MTREKNQKYLREPFLNSEVAFGQEITNISSPNEAYKMVVSHRLAYAHRKYIYLFNLENAEGEIVENFEPLATTGKVIWSEDSLWVAIEVGVEKVGFLLMDIVNKKFAYIPFRRKPAAKVKLTNKEIQFVMPDDFIDVLNSEKLIGGGTTELPRIKYEKAKDINIKLKELTFFGKSELANVFQSSTEPYYFEPQRTGFWKFEGNLPQTTASGYNGRPFEMYQLEVFAEYGDAVSKKWLDMIIEKVDGKYQLYKPVTEYLGLLNRKDFLD